MAKRDTWRPTPADLARWRECFAAHAAGESYRAIGERLEISGVMARQRALKHLKWQQRIEGSIVSEFQLRSVPQAQLQQATAHMTREQARLTEHRIEGLPVVFNPTTAPYKIVCIGAGPLNVSGELELHCTVEAFSEYKLKADVQRAVTSMIETIKAGLARQGREL